MLISVDNDFILIHNIRNQITAQIKIRTNINLCIIYKGKFEFLLQTTICNKFVPGILKNM